MAQTRTMGFAEAAQAFVQACGQDIDRHCRQVNLGGGRLEACLRGQRISARCRTAVPQIQSRIDDRLQAQRVVFRTCDRDTAQRCQGIQGQANILRCLVQARNVSSQCNAAIDNAGWR